MTTTGKPTFAECDKILCQAGSIFELEEVVIRGRKQPVWKHAPRTFRDFLSSVFEKWSSRGLVSEPVPLSTDSSARQHFTYGEVWKKSIDLAAWLREQGVRQGGRVAIGGNNSSGWMVAFTACHLLGAVPVLLNATLHIDSQIHCLGLTKPLLVLADAAVAEVLGPNAKSLAGKGVGKIYCWDSIDHLPSKARAGLQSLNPKPSPQSVEEVKSGSGLEALDTESDGMIMFTSGTTNLPKGVIVSQRACMTHVLASSVSAARAILRAGGTFEQACAAHTPPEQQSTMLLPVPLFHVTGVCGWMMRGMYLGAKIAYLRRWSVPDAVKVIVDEKINVFGGVPAIATAVIQSGLLPDDHVVDGITYGGAPPPQRLADDIAKRWPSCVATHAYGMTETTGLHTALTGPDYIANPEAVGLAIPPSEIRIVDPDTLKPVGTNVMGVLQCRGPNIMTCYVDNPKATKEALDDEGWLSTGDLGIIDETGYLYIRDRAKDMIIRGGENIASAEVENAIHLDDRIAEAAAVPVPDDVLGERVGLGVSLAPGVTATPQSLMAAVEPRLRYPARPAIIVIFDALPRNANAKIVKSDIKRIVGEEWKKQGGGVKKARL